MEDKNIYLLITGFVLLILGIALLTPSAELVNDVTAKTSLADEAIDISSARIENGSVNEATEFTVTNYPTSWKVEDCPLTSVTYGNSTTDYTLTTDYLITLSTGVLTLVNTSTVIDGTNSTFIDYVYCSDDYMNAGWARSILNLVPGFWAIALMLIGIGIFFAIAKSEGILDKL